LQTAAEVSGQPDCGPNPARLLRHALTS
jgi:hypothetical protein